MLLEIATGPGVLTIAEVARSLRVSRATAYKLVEHGALEHVRVGNQIRVPRTAVQALLERMSALTPWNPHQP